MPFAITHCKVQLRIPYHSLLTVGVIAHAQKHNMQPSSAWFEAAFEGDVEKLREHIPGDVNAYGHALKYRLPYKDHCAYRCDPGGVYHGRFGGYSALAFAALQKHVEAARFLIELGACPDANALSHNFIPSMREDELKFVQDIVASIEEQRKKASAVSPVIRKVAQKQSSSAQLEALYRTSPDIVMRAFACEAKRGTLDGEALECILYLIGVQIEQSERLEDVYLGNGDTLLNQWKEG